MAMIVVNHEPKFCMFTSLYKENYFTNLSGTLPLFDQTSLAPLISSKLVYIKVSGVAGSAEIFEFPVTVIVTTPLVATEPSLAVPANVSAEVLLGVGKAFIPKSASSGTESHSVPLLAL